MRMTLHIPGNDAVTLDTASDLAAGGAPDQTLAQAIWLSGRVPPPPLCSGLGRCGRCRVRFDSPAPAPLPAEESLLPARELAQGWRLACRRRADALDSHVELTLPRPREISPAATVGHGGSRTAPRDRLLLAVDLGTTSLYWRAIAPDGTVAADGREINPQMGAGSEIMSRLAAARRPGGLERLSRLVLAALRRIVDGLPAPTTEICVAANTAMTAILLGRNVEGLAAAPYRVPVAGNGTERLPGLPPIYIPPQPAPFVGGDVSAGLAVLEQGGAPQYPFLLADLGTNGELALAVDAGVCLLASVPLGPALEGIGLTFGDMAGPRVATAFSLTPTGLAAATWDGGPPERICGTGYLSLLHALLRAGVLDADGAFRASPPSPLGRGLAAGLEHTRGEARLPLPRGLYLAAGDVEEILKVKAAFSLALERLLEEAGLKPAALRAVYLSGALGSHASGADLEALGFVPQGLGARLRGMDNSSLEGAQWLLLHPECRPALARRCAACRTLDLTADPAFTHNYLRHMRFA